MTRHLLIPLALCMALSVPVAHAGESPDATPPTALERLTEDDARELFLRCCWALGRAGFHYCDQYGVCESDQEASCAGIGAAEGMSVDCKTKPADLPDEGG